MNRNLILRYYSLIEELDDIDYLISVIAYGVAPTLTENKPSSLIGFSNRKLKLWKKYRNQVCKKLGVKYYELKERPHKMLVLFYKEHTLRHCLNEGHRLMFLNENGYKQAVTLKDKLGKLKERFEEGCPHEVGVFLGIPIEDIESFIENQGEDYLFYKYWKVYHNPEKTSALFKGYDKAKEKVVLKLEEKYYERGKEHLMNVCV